MASMFQLCFNCSILFKRQYFTEISRHVKRWEKMLEKFINGIQMELPSL